jgi:hypothetical protein
VKAKTPEQAISQRSKPKSTKTPIRPIEKVNLVFEDIEERVSSVEGLGRQLARNIEELKTALKEAGQVVPIAPDRMIHLTLEQAEKLRKFWWAISDISSSDLICPKDSQSGEVVVLKLAIQSVDDLFSEDIDRQILRVQELEGGAQ